jgi:hypothetical protein
MLGVTVKTAERWCRRKLLAVRRRADGTPYRPYQVIRSSVERVKRERGGRCEHEQ